MPPKPVPGRRSARVALGALVALGVLLVATAAALACEPAAEPTLDQLPPLTIDVTDATPPAPADTRPRLVSETWQPCADQGDGSTLRLCPGGQPMQARVDSDALAPPLVEVDVETVPPPCGYAAARQAEAEQAARPCPAQARRCAPQRVGRIFIAALVGWYALGLLLATLMILRRQQQRRRRED